MDQSATEIRQHEASNIVSSYMGWSAGASILPVPILDLAAVTAVQVKMVADLAKLYEVPFSKNAIKGIIAGLLGSLVPAGLVRGTSSLLKAVPGVGALLGVLSAPAFTTAATYAIGKIFVQHFEAGGNLFNFDTKAKSGEFQSAFEEGMENDADNSKATA